MLFIVSKKREEKTIAFHTNCKRSTLYCPVLYPHREMASDDEVELEPTQSQTQTEGILWQNNDDSPEIWGQLLSKINALKNFGEHFVTFLANLCSFC